MATRSPLGVDRVLDKRLADRAIERRDQGQVLGLVGHVVGRVDLLAQGRGLGPVVDGFLDRLLHPPLLMSAHADTAGRSQQSNSARGRGWSSLSTGAGRAHLPGVPRAVGPAGSLSNVCGPTREIEPLTRSSRGSLPRKGSHAWSDRFPHRSLQPSAACHFPPSDCAQERPAQTLGRPLHAHHQEPGRAHAVQRRDPKQAAQFWVSSRRDGASSGHDEMSQRLIKLTHTRVPSVVGGTMSAAALGRTGKSPRKIP